MKIKISARFLTLHLAQNDLSHRPILRQEAGMQSELVPGQETTLRESETDVSVEIPQRKSVFQGGLSNEVK